MRAVMPDGDSGIVAFPNWQAYFHSFVNAGGNDMPSWDLKVVCRKVFPVFGGRFPGPASEFCGELLLGAVSEFAGDVGDGQCALHQQGAGGIMPSFHPVLVGGHAHDFSKFLAEILVSQSMSMAELLNILLLPEIGTEKFTGELDQLPGPVIIFGTLDSAGHEVKECGQQFQQ